MATPTIYGDLQRPGNGLPPKQASVLVELVGDNGQRIAGAMLGSGVTVIGAHEADVDSAGHWEVSELVPNVLIEPAGTVYRVTETVDGKSHVYPITVPNTAGTYYSRSLRSDFPGMLPLGALALEIARAMLAESTKIPLDQKGAPNGVAELDANRLIKVENLPPWAISDVFVVSSQAEMLALAAQPGDVARRTDTTPNKTFMLKQVPATVLGNWLQISSDALVASVNGRIGDVTGLAENADVVLLADELANFTAKLGTWRGEYVPGTTYAIGDAVEWNGSSYIATEDGVLGVPPEPEIPVEIITGPKGDKGDKGDPGGAGPPGAGAELGFIESTATFTMSTPTSVDILTLAVDTNGPINIVFSGLLYNTIASAGTIVQLLEDGAIIDSSYPAHPVAGVAVRLTTNMRRNPAPGNHTYTIRCTRWSSSGSSVALGTAATPLQLSVVGR